MFKRKLMKVLFISACMLAFSSTAAFAAAVEGQAAAYEGVQEIDSKLYEKQQEIDRYLFEEHAKEIESMGFKVTSTFTTDSYVEIGIIPYSDANANYLYEAFGKEMIKVVEGDQAVILNPEVIYMQAPDTAVSDTDSAEAADTDTEAINETDASKAADSGMADTVVDDSMAADTSVIDDVGAAEMEITSVEDTNAEAADNGAVDPEVLAYTSGEAVTESEANSLLPVILLCTAGMVVLIGGTVYWIKKRNNFSR